MQILEMKIKIEQMINWSIFSDKIRYVDSCMNITLRLTIRPLEEKKHRMLFSTLEIRVGKYNRYMRHHI